MKASVMRLAALTSRARRVSPLSLFLALFAAAPCAAEFEQ